MRVLLVTQVFYPEYFKSTELARYLSERGHDVEVLTSIPNYPDGVYYKGWGVFKRRTESQDGYKIYRAFQSPRGRSASAIGLSLYYLTYAICATFWVLFYFAFKKKYDAIVVFQTSPITQVIPAVILKKLRRTPLYTWVLDVWPDSVLATLHTNNALLRKPLDIITEWVYSNSHKILISSPDFATLVNRHRDYSEKIIDFPNWCEDITLQAPVSIPTLPSGFRIMMAGNIGKAQDIDSITRSILDLSSNKDIKWIFVGGGSKLEWLKKFVVERDLQDSVTILGRFPFESMRSFYEQADVMLLTLKKSEWPHLNATIPARVQSYMSASKPIVGMVGSGAASLIHSADAGMVAPAGDNKGLASIIMELKDDTKRLKQMGENGRKYYETHFTPEVCINHLEKILGHTI